MTHQYSPTTLHHLVLSEGISLVDAIAQLPQIDSEQRQIETAALTSAKVLSAGCIAGGLGLFAASAVPLAIFSAGVGAIGWAATGMMNKPGNKRSRDGERYLINASEIRNWIVMAWQAGYPIGQILAGYNAYCETVGGEMQFKRPEISNHGEDFVHCLNHSPDAISKLPPVAKIGNTIQLKARKPSKSAPDTEYEEPMLPDNAIPLAPPEIIARYEAFKAQQAKAQASPVQVLERSYQQAVAEEQATQAMEAIATTAAEKILANPAKSMAWFGGERTGKSYGAAQVSKRAGVNTYQINLASYAGPSGSEDSEYWSHAVASFSCDLDFDAETADQAQALIGKALAVFHQFKRDPDPSILVFDEWVLTAAKANRWSSLLEPLVNEIASLATTLSSSGTKRGKGLWLISPKLVAGELTDAGKAIKGLPLCYVAIPRGRQVEWNGKQIVFDSSLHKQLCSNYDPPPAPNYDHASDRKAYIGGSWLPLGW